MYYNPFTSMYSFISNDFPGERFVGDKFPRLVIFKVPTLEFKIKGKFATEPSEEGNFRNIKEFS